MSSPTRIYRGRAVDELIPRIHEELGAEAIIVRRREGLTGGFLGFFQHPYVEIEAMPGTPSIDVYDEQQNAPAGGGMPAFDGHYALGSLAPGAQPGEAPPASLPPPAASTGARGALAPAPPAGSAYVSAHLAALARAGPLPGAPAHAPSPHERAAPSATGFEELIPPPQQRGAGAAPFAQPERAPSPLPEYAPPARITQPHAIEYVPPAPAPPPPPAAVQPVLAAPAGACARSRRRSARPRARR